jgi:hypothetical protein
MRGITLNCSTLQQRSLTLKVTLPHSHSGRVPVTREAYWQFQMDDIDIPGVREGLGFIVRASCLPVSLTLASRILLALTPAHDTPPPHCSLLTDHSSLLQASPSLLVRAAAQPLPTAAPACSQVRACVLVGFVSSEGVMLYGCVGGGRAASATSLCSAADSGVAALKRVRKRGGWRKFPGCC